MVIQQSLPSLSHEEDIYPFVTEDALSGTTQDPSPTLMIRDVLGSLMCETEAAKSLKAEQEEEGLSSTPENETNEGEHINTEEQAKGSPDKPTEEHIEKQYAE